jgi:hypothetical protein
VACVVGGTLALTDGMSFGLVVGVGFNLLFWFWITAGAWRHTVWSSSD